MKSISQFFLILSSLAATLCAQPTADEIYQLNLNSVRTLVAWHNTSAQADCQIKAANYQKNLDAGFKPPAEPPPSEIWTLDENAFGVLYRQKFAVANAGNTEAVDLFSAVAKSTKSCLPAPPIVVAPAAPTVLVGPDSGDGKHWLTVAGDTSPDGSFYSDARGTFQKHVVPSPFGAWVWWERVADLKIPATILQQPKK